MIRPLAEEDLEAYVALRRRSLAESPRSFSASPDRDVASNLEHLRAQLAHAPDWLLFGAFRDGTLAGAAGAIRREHRLALWGMYVAPEARREGLGRALLDACIAHARTLPGVTRVELSVSDAAVAARQLYDRAGFLVHDADGNERHMSLLLTESSENTSV